MGKLLARRMLRLDSYASPTASAFGVVLLVVCSALALVSREKTYLPKSGEEVDVLSLVLASEVKANNSTKKEVVCLSIDGSNPDGKLVKSLRQGHLNVRSSAEWPKKFNCGFEVQLEYSQFDLSRSVTLHSTVVDLREINTGQGDLALIQRDGEYLLRKIGETWSISEYVPTKHSS
jgi:hypothetical protein